MPDWQRVKRTVMSRIHYELALGYVAEGHQTVSKGFQQFLESLSLDPLFALRHPILTAHIMKRVLTGGFKTIGGQITASQRDRSLLKCKIPQPSWHGTAALVAGTTEVNTGIGRYVDMLDAGLQQAGVQTTRVAPTLPVLPDFTYRLLQWFGRDLRAFLTNYPLWSTYPEADIYHVTQQTLASLLLFRRPSGKVVVTVHDIFPYMVRNDPQLGSPYGSSEHVYYRLPVAGLKRANHLIAVSEYTKQCIIEHLGIGPEKTFRRLQRNRSREIPASDGPCCDP